MLDIKANGQSLELGREIVALTYAVNDIGSTDQAQATFSNTFTIPATNYNVSVLGFISNLNVNSSVSPYVKVACEVYQDAVLISRGHLRIVRYNKKERSIDIEVYGENINWFEPIKDKYLSDLDFSEYDHTYTADNIIDSFTNTEGYIYPLVDYGLFEDRVTDETYTEEWYPAIFVHTILKKICTSIGYKIVGSFLKNPIFKKIIIPFSNKNFVNNTEPNPEVKVSYSGDIVGNTFIPDVEEFDINSEWNISTGRYTAATSKEVVFSGSIKWVDGAATGTGRFGAFKNGSSVPIEDIVFTYGEYTSLEFKPIQLQAGDYLFFGVQTVLNPGTAYFAIDSFLTNYITNSIIKGAEVNVNRVLPNVKQVDLIKLLTFNYRLVLSSDEHTKTLYFNQFSDLQNNIVNAIDWSGKLNSSQPEEFNFNELVQNYGKINYLTYKEDDKDLKLVDYRSINNDIGFGDGQIDIENDFIEDEVNLFEGEFASTININSFENRCYIPIILLRILGDAVYTFSSVTNAGGFAQININNSFEKYSVGQFITILNSSVSGYNGVWRIIAKTSTIQFILDLAYTATAAGDVRVFKTENQDLSPRILILSENTDLDNLGSISSLTIDGTTINSAPFSYFYKQTINNSTIDSYIESLAYDVPNISNPNDVSIKDRYFLNFINILNSPKNVKAYFKLNQLDINNLDFLTPIYIEEYKGYFYLNKIVEYDSTGDSTLCELIKIA